MLDQHEYAVLRLVKEAPENVSSDHHALLEALLEKGLIRLEQLPSGAQLPRITNQGRIVLRTALP